MLFLPEQTEAVQPSLEKTDTYLTLSKLGCPIFIRFREGTVTDCPWKQLLPFKMRTHICGFWNQLTD